METFALRDVESSLGIRRSIVARLIREGFVTPTRGSRREYRFTFQDIIILRTASALAGARVAPRRIVHSLKRLRAALPQELPLTGLRITALNDDIVVTERGSRWDAESGQHLLDFEVTREHETLRVLRNGAAQSNAAARSATQWLEHALAVESEHPRAAETAYRNALQCNPGLADAYINLGVLLTERRRASEAEVIYRTGIARCPTEAALHFNLGVLLEDLRRSDEALRAYAQALKIDAGYADAHFNAARLHELAGDTRQAIRHYAAYRRLQEKSR